MRVTCPTSSYWGSAWEKLIIRYLNWSFCYTSFQHHAHACMNNVALPHNICIFWTLFFYLCMVEWKIFFWFEGLGGGLGQLVSTILSQMVVVVVVVGGGGGGGGGGGA